MAVYREDTIRQMIFRDHLSEIHVKKEDYVTPQARAYIEDMRLTLVVEGEAENPDIHPAKEQQGGKYVGLDGNVYREKPEQMTHLYGNTLVEKTHPRIVLRGKLDTLEAQIICLQACCGAREKLVRDLDEALAFTRRILSCEVTGKPLGAGRLLRLDEGGLREQSHNPQKYFGFGHILPDHRLGGVCAGLNLLRALAREAELAAVAAFCKEGQVQRGDLLQALNRLSSAFYIMMCRQKAGQYGEETENG